MLNRPNALLSPLDLSPEGIECWLAQAEQIVQEQFPQKKSPAAPGPVPDQILQEATRPGAS